MNKFNILTFKLYNKNDILFLLIISISNTYFFESNIPAYTELCFLS